MLQLGAFALGFLIRASSKDQSDTGLFTMTERLSSMRLPGGA